ncbi:MAG: hypothetical protein HEP70_19405 [Rhodobiaceae bacterium]|nr:hypothetical protein [Rhodobiaceae bacterium]
MTGQTVRMAPTDPVLHSASAWQMLHSSVRPLHGAGRKSRCQARYSGARHCANRRPQGHRDRYATAQREIPVRFIDERGVFVGAIHVD